LIIAKHVTPSEVVLECLQVPIITKSRAFTYDDSKPPTFRIKIVTNSCILGFQPINGYTSKPEEFEGITLFEYFTTYETDHITRGNTTPITKDNLDYYVYNNKKIIRFIDFYPPYSNS
jgi:hypothetical protein